MLVVFNLFSLISPAPPPPPFPSLQPQPLNTINVNCKQVDKLEWREMEKEELVDKVQAATSSSPLNKEESPKHSKHNLSLGGGGDRLKRDEWSEGAVSSLLDAYESKWVLRNRAKLKGHDWEDVARYVSSRANSTKSPKTQTQCKNKIESMKKRYRSESATSDASSWPLFNRLDLLLRCRTSPCTTQPPLLLLDQQSAPPPPVAPPAPPALPPSGTNQNSHESNGGDRVAKEEGIGAQTLEDGSEKMSMDMDSSTPMSDTVKEKLKSKKMKIEYKNKMKKKMGRQRGDWDVAESIRWLAEVMVRSEQARMDTMRELEKMRVEAEAKRGEMDLKRTEIIANTQLQIAQLLAGNGKGIDSSLRIGRN